MDAVALRALLGRMVGSAAKRDAVWDADGCSSCFGGTESRPEPIASIGPTASKADGPQAESQAACRRPACAELDRSDSQCPLVAGFRPSPVF